MDNEQNKALGFSTNNQLPGDESQTKKEFVKNLAAYQYWQAKLPHWEAKQILAKLRSYNVFTSKNDIIEKGEVSYSAYELFRYWLQKFGMQAKFLENFGFIWAAAERLWDEFLPDLFYVEKFIQRHNQLRNSIGVELAHVILPRHLESWAEFAQAMVPPFQSLDEIEPLYPRTNWITIIISDIADLCRNACAEKNKLLMEVVNFIYQMEEKFPDAPAYSRGFLQLLIWFAIINNKTEEVERLLNLYGYNLTMDDPIYIMISDLYNNPLPFAFNRRDSEKGMIFYHQLLQKIHNQNQ